MARRPHPIYLAKVRTICDKSKQFAQKMLFPTENAEKARKDNFVTSGA